MSEAESEAPPYSVKGKKKKEANRRISNSPKEEVKNGMTCQLKLKKSKYKLSRSTYLKKNAYP